MIPLISENVRDDVFISDLIFCPLYKIPSCEHQYSQVLDFDSSDSSLFDGSWKGGMKGRHWIVLWLARNAPSVGNGVIDKLKRKYCRLFIATGVECFEMREILVGYYIIFMTDAYKAYWYKK